MSHLRYLKKILIKHSRICQFFLVQSPDQFIHNERVPSSNSRHYVYLLDYRFLCIRRNCHKFEQKRGKKKKERRYARVHPSTIYHSRYQYVFLSMTSRDSMLVPAPTCSLGSSNICIFASPLFPPFPTSRGIHAWIEGGSIEEFVCLISMEGRWSLKRFAIPNLRMIIHS